MLASGKDIISVKAVALEFIHKLTILFTAHRENLTLINACELDYATDVGVEQVKELGWNVNKKDTFYTATSITVLASKLLEDDKELKRAKAKLEGCSFLLDSSWYDSVLSQALQFELQKEKSEARLSEESKKLANENKTLKQSIAELSKKLEDRSQESELNLRQLLSTQEELEKLYEELSVAKGRVVAVIKGRNSEAFGTKILNELIDDLCALYEEEYLELKAENSKALDKLSVEKVSIEKSKKPTC